MIGRPKAKQLTEEQRVAFSQASAHQSGGMSSPKTYDVNYPLFEVQVGKKVLVYIPNHLVQLEDGTEVLRADRFAAHTAKKGRAFLEMRCTSEVVSDALGLDGSCPLCNGASECWDLVNLKWKEFCQARGLDHESADVRETYKNDYKDLIKDMSIQSSDTYITFPIVVVDSDPKTPTKPKLDADGKLVGTPMFYTVRTRAFEDKWGSAFDTLQDTDPTAEEHNPAGRWALLNFIYTPKSGEQNKRDAARNLKVSFLQKEGLGDWEKYFDDMTKDWTPEVAQDVLVRNAVRDMSEQIAAADELLEDTRNTMRMYQLKQGGGTTLPANTSADEALSQFGATPQQAPETPQTPATPQTAGEMPKSVGVAE